jgi:propane monooxygenase coupling protein
VTTTATSTFGAVNKTSSNRAGMTLMNDQVGEVIAQVMKDKPGVTITYLPSMIRVDGAQRTDYVYDEFAEALGEEPGSFTAADLEESMSTHYGRMVHEDDRTIMFANPEDAAEYLGFDLVAATTADTPAPRAAAD